MTLVSDVMKINLQTVALLMMVFLTTDIRAQVKRDSLMREIALKEVEVHTIRKSKYPKTNFYQSSMLSGTEDILSRVEGVSLIRRGPIGMEPVLRGFSSGQINVVIDGMKIFGACTDKMDPATIYTEPVNLKSIDIRYGGDGIGMGSTIGGTLNLKLADATVDSAGMLTGSLASGYYTSAGAVQNVVAMNYGAQRWAIRLAGVYRKAGDYTDGASNQIAFSQYEKLNMSIAAKYLLNKHSSVKADFLLDNGWNIGFPALPMDVGYAKARIASISYEHLNHSGFIQELQTKIYANTVRHAMDDTRRPQVSMHMDMPGRSQTWGSFAQVKLAAVGRHFFSVKADFYYNTVKAEMTMFPYNAAPMYMRTWPENFQVVAGVYIEDEILLNEESRFGLKLRVESATAKVTDEIGRNQFSVLGYDVQDPLTRVLKSFNISYTRKLGQLLTLYVSTGLNERSPTTSERFGFYLFNRMDNHDFVGNPLLKNEQSFNNEINLLLSNEHFSWKISAFGSRVERYIMGVTQSGLNAMTPGAVGVRAYDNIPYAWLFGAESSFNCQLLNRHFILYHTLKWLRGKDDKNIALPQIAPLKSITSARFRHDQLFIQLENELSWRQNQVSLDFGEKASPGYSLFNLRCGYGFKLRKYSLDLTAGVENMFDKAYSEHLDWGTVLRPGRNIFSMVTLKF